MKKIYYSSAAFLSILSISLTAMDNPYTYQNDKSPMKLPLVIDFKEEKKLTKTRKSLLKRYYSPDYTVIGELLTELLRQSLYFRMMLTSKNVKNQPFCSYKFQNWYLRVNKAIARILIDQKRFVEAGQIFSKITKVKSRWNYVSNQNDIEKLDKLYAVLNEKVFVEFISQSHPVIAHPQPQRPQLSYPSSFDSYNNVLEKLKSINSSPEDGFIAEEQPVEDNPSIKAIKDNPKKLPHAPTTLS